MVRRAVPKRLLGQLLKARGVLDEAQIQEVLAHQRREGGLFGEILVQLSHASPGEVAAALAEQAGLESVDLDGVTPSPEALELVDAETARAFGLLPLALRGEALVVALSDPLNTPVLEDLAFTTGVEVKGVVADAARVRALVEQCYGKAGTFQDAIDAARRSSVDDGDAQSAAQSAPVVRLLNSILHRAIRDRASDVHFEVFPGELRVRYRVDGSLYEIEAPPAHLGAPLVARIKVMSDLDIAETKLPQDGRIELAIDGRPVDLRVATLPTVSGESAVLRVLDKSSVSLDLAALGAGEEEQALLARLSTLPHGIVLLTGPTGSGKTTTLYSMLARINDPEVKIVTVEDPVEYDIDGVVQVPIQSDIGVDYARVLRSVLRHDPDKIMVGEIRDEDTAEIAVEASLTGHLVLSTVHTNDAPSAVARLLDLSLDPYLVAATLEAVVAQRLVRRICRDCRAEFEPDDDLVNGLGEDAELVRGRRLSFGRGCDLCYHTGYRGRTALFEIMEVDDSIRTAILEGASTDELRRLARAAGMTGLSRSGLRAVLEGITTVEEVLHETIGH